MKRTISEKTLTIAEKRISDTINLYEETIDFIKILGYDISDITSASIDMDNIRYYMPFEQFKKIAEQIDFVPYHTGDTVLPAINNSLKIYLKNDDAIYIERWILNGAECWAKNLPDYYDAITPSLFDTSITDPKYFLNERR